MESPLSLSRMVWPAKSQSLSFPKSLGRFMESPLSRLRMKWDHEPEVRKHLLFKPSELRFMGRENRSQPHDSSGDGFLTPGGPQVPGLPLVQYVLVPGSLDGPMHDPVALPQIAEQLDRLGHVRNARDRGSRTADPIFIEPRVQVVLNLLKRRTR